MSLCTQTMMTVGILVSLMFEHLTDSSECQAQESQHQQRQRERQWQAAHSSGWLQLASQFIVVAPTMFSCGAFATQVLDASWLLVWLPCVVVLHPVPVTSGLCYNSLVVATAPQESNTMNRSNVWFWLLLILFTRF